MCVQCLKCSEPHSKALSSTSPELCAESGALVLLLDPSGQKAGSYPRSNWSRCSKVLAPNSTGQEVHREAISPDPAETQRIQNLAHRLCIVNPKANWFLCREVLLPRRPRRLQQSLNPTCPEFSTQAFITSPSGPDVDRFLFQFLLVYNYAA